MLRALLCALIWISVLMSCSQPPEAGSSAPVSPADGSSADGSSADGSPADGSQAIGPVSERVEGVSLLGQNLNRPQLDPEFRQLQEGFLAEAEAQLNKSPEDVDAWIWKGRRIAYLGRYQDAIAVYSQALESLRLGPEEEARLLRHRGHRRLSLRRLDSAAADFEKAAEQVQGLPDRIELDGLPNARNIPTSTLGTNIWYHLGLTRFLKADYEGALNAYEECMALAGNPDMRVATAYWQHMTLTRLGRMEQAQTLLQSISSEAEIIENQAYHRLLLGFRGELDLKLLLEEAEKQGSAAFATTGFGAGHAYLAAGDSQEAMSIWRRVVEGDSWASFGHIAAEAELARAAH